MSTIVKNTAKAVNLDKVTEPLTSQKRINELSDVSATYNKNIARFLNTRSQKKIHNFKKRYKWWDHVYIYTFLRKIAPSHSAEINTLLDIDDWIFNKISYEVIVSKRKDALQEIINDFSTEDWEFFNSYLAWFAIKKLIYGIEVEEGCKDQYESIHTAIKLSHLPDKSKWLDHVAQEIPGWWD